MLPDMNERRGYQLFLLTAGVVLAVVGVIMWGVAANQASHDESVSELTNAMLGWNDSGYVSPARVWMWVGIGALILGVLMVIAWVIVRAASGTPTESVVDRPSLAEVRAERTAGAESSVTTDLTALAELHDRGLLSDSEFEAAKSRALGSN